MVRREDILVIIPARGGSKGIPHKNIKLLEGIPLIHYSIDFARSFTTDEHICLTTDDVEIAAVAAQKGLTVPFMRPAELAGDTAGSHGVMLHALRFFEEKGKSYKALLLLQPTSPFRKREDLEAMLAQYQEDLDMVVSVGISHQNPYFSLYEENKQGFIELSKKGYFESRQECPNAYYLNGSLYLINVAAITQKPISQFTKIKKQLMNDIHSVDIDTPLDWLICETIIKNGYYKHEYSTRNSQIGY